ncbi:MAG: alanine racemase [Parasporobacterium sp.]|nr:alanine racemase [Parasporobacterium sp.]
MDTVSEKCYRLWAEVDLSAIRTNILNLQSSFTPGTKTCAVIKADGYGHGAQALAGCLADIVDFYAAATMEEAMEIRSAGVSTPVLILGYVHPVNGVSAAGNDIRFTVYDYDTARELSDLCAGAGLKLKVHIKADTGMGRIGFMPDEASADTVLAISRLPGLEIEGIFTHFANADDACPDSALAQLELFRKFIGYIEDRNVHIPVKHCANSAASTWIRETDMYMNRLGISIYGLYPSEYVHQTELIPAMTLKSHVVNVKTVPAGTCVGYGSTWTAAEERVIATIPVGYADGYMRSLSNKGSVLINGHRYPIAGRVCMDQIMADVTGPYEVNKGDEVVLIGSSGDETITMEEISELAGSFNYEFACGLGRRIPRLYYENGVLKSIKHDAGIKYDFR